MYILCFLGQSVFIYGKKYVESWGVTHHKPKSVSNFNITCIWTGSLIAISSENFCFRYYTKRAKTNHNYNSYLPFSSVSFESQPLFALGYVLSNCVWAFLKIIIISSSLPNNSLGCQDKKIDYLNNFKTKLFGCHFPEDAVAHEVISLNCIIIRVMTNISIFFWKF